MGNPVGFLELERVNQKNESPETRVEHFKEFIIPLTPTQAKVQAGRCMDCGIPFCNNGCPVNNIIPDFNNLVYEEDWKKALEVLHSTNNFPEFTGRVCPAPCEAACTLNFNDVPVGIKSVEQSIIDRGWKEGWVVPQPSKNKSGKSVSVVGSGPAGLAAAQQLARLGHTVTVFEKNTRIGGLLRYGIPDFKMEKFHLDRRVEQMKLEGVTFKTGILIGDESLKPSNTSFKEIISPKTLLNNFDVVLLAGGSEQPRDLPVPGRDLKGVHFAMDFLPQQNKVCAGDKVSGQIIADGKDVVVIGGGDTGSDCVGTSNRHKAKSITQFELMPQPPDEENKNLVWPYWPQKLRTSSSHIEGCDREFAIATKEFIGKNGKLTGLKTCDLNWSNGKFEEVVGSEKIYPVDLVFLAMGFVSPIQSFLEGFEVEKDVRGNVNASENGEKAYQTNVAKVFSAGDMRRGQSLVVWAIREGRQAAVSIDNYLFEKN
jgi:glutamate synthase (NADPH/NADH) small chain